MGRILRRWKARLKQVTDRISIQAKLIAAYIFIILIPIILFSWYMFKGFYQNTIEDTLKKNQYVLAGENTHILNHMEGMRRTAQIFLADKEAMNYLQSPSDLDVMALIDFKMSTYSNLQRLMYNNPSIANVRLFTGNPNAREIWPIFFNESRVIERGWYKSVLAQKGAPWWGILENEREMAIRTKPDDPDQSTYVSLIQEVDPQTDRPVGLIEVDMRIEDFFQKTFSPIQDDQSHMLVIDRSGHLFTDMSSPFFKAIDLEQLRRNWEGRPDREDSSFTFMAGDTPYLCLTLPIEGLDAYLVNVVSLEKPLKQINQTRNWFIAAAVILITLLSVITYLLQSLILKKLHILRDSMKKVRRGDLNVHIDMDAGGEVGELAHHFRQMMKKMNELIVEGVNKRAATKEAELNSLKNQIDAHFLYNTLENLKMLAEVEEQYTISDALTSLGAMMRYSLKWSHDHVQLRHEIQHIQNYMAIMNIRYDDKLVLQLDIPPGYQGQEVLKMSLQPLVENAVKHGMRTERTRREGLTIRIRAWQRDEDMLIEVTDNGAGMSAAQLALLHEKLTMDDARFQIKYGHRLPGEQEGNGIGLRNVTQRIQMYYGYEYGITVESEEGAYTQVRMKLPYLILSGGLSEDEKSAYRG
ncbi:sensor histidine kinase [Paenibacillus filicis]|uniref:histidine kinase n=1 Tax=Paenibacillus filicis TaxID=669464 RepID=A0ABU9DGQ7_9BACL